jgi:hypothetical protein
MTSFKIYVSKQLDGYSFNLLPSVKESIKKKFPNANPANNIFVSYDLKSDFSIYYEKLETYIFPALLGLNENNDLDEIDKLEFVDSSTGNILHKMILHDEKV